MDREFWLERWNKQEIGFHQPLVNPWLEKHWPELGLPAGSTVFVPLCGKSMDMGWLREQGHSVVGVELAESAVQAFYQETGEPCSADRLPYFVRYTGGQVTIYCGDFMNLWVRHLPGVSAVYDRGSLVALPPRMRAHYADHLQRIIPEGCQILLLTLEYDQSRVPGPPHSVEEAEVNALFGARCSVRRLGSVPVTQMPPRFARSGLESMVEAVYRLVKSS